MNALQSNQTRRGVSLLMVTFSVSILATLSLSMVMVNTAVTKEQQAEKHQIASLLAAESGVSAAAFAMNNGGDGNIGTAGDPVVVEGVRYWVEATDLGNGLISLSSTGVDSQDGSRIEVTMEEVSNSIWTWGAFGDEEMTMGSNSHVDSYNSTLGTWDSQITSGNGNSAHANAAGDIGSNGDVTLKQNAEVYGNAVSGPMSTTSVLGNAIVSGSTTPMSEPQPFPALVIPSFPMLPEVSYAGTQTLSTGDYYFESLEVEVGAELTIIGPATIVVDDFEMMSNSELWVDDTNGPVEIFVIDDFILSSNTLMAATSYNPASLSINLESDNIINPTLNVQLSEVNFESNAVLYGTIYAPNAAVDIDSNFELFGAVVARQVHLSSWSRVHFDENLSTALASSSFTWQPLCWRTVGYTPDNAMAGGGQYTP